MNGAGGGAVATIGATWLTALGADPWLGSETWLGVLTTENVGEFIMLRAALRGAEAAELPA